MRILDESILTRLEFQFLPIIALLDGEGTMDISKRPTSNKWSIAENIAHLGRYQVIFLERMERIFSEESPQFPRYKSDEDLDFNEWVAKSYEKLAFDIEKDRKYINSRIFSLSDNELARKGRHPKLGWMDVVEWAEFFLLHEAHHLYTIFWLKHECINDD